MDIKKDNLGGSDCRAGHSHYRIWNVYLKRR